MVACFTASTEALRTVSLDGTSACRSVEQLLRPSAAATIKEPSLRPVSLVFMAPPNAIADSSCHWPTRARSSQPPAKLETKTVPIPTATPSLRRGSQPPPDTPLQLQ